MSLTYFAPTGSADALAILRDFRPKVIAGCTDYFPGRPEGHLDDGLLDISSVTDLHGIRETDDGWRIGAATTWTDLVRTALPAAFDGLKAAAREVGSIQIQNRATLAGNICNASPAADGVPPLLTLDARVEIASADRVRTVPLGNFITGVRQVDLAADELVMAILVSRRAGASRSAFLKLGSRRYLVISIAMAACIVEVTDGEIVGARIAVGSCSPVATRLPELERALFGRKLSDLAASDLSDDSYFAPLTPIDDVRGSSAFRRDAVSELCRRVVLQACGVGQ